MTVYKSDAVVAGIMPDYSRAGLLLSRTAVYTITTEPISGDTIQMVPVPKNAQIIDILVENNSLVQWASLATLHVGDGADTDRFFKWVFTGQILRNSFFASNTLQRDPLASHVFTYTGNDTIDLFFNGTHNSDVTGSKIAMTVIYKMEGELADEDF